MSTILSVTVGRGEETIPLSHSLMPPFTLVLPVLLSARSAAELADNALHPSVPMSHVLRGRSIDDPMPRPSHFLLKESSDWFKKELIL